jgi:hypothetical protein
MREAGQIELKRYPDKASARSAEKAAIDRLRPVHNIARPQPLMVPCADCGALPAGLLDDGAPAYACGHGTLR